MKIISSGTFRQVFQLQRILYEENNGLKKNLSHFFGFEVFHPKSQKYLHFVEAQIVTHLLIFWVIIFSTRSNVPPPSHLNLLYFYNLP